MLKIIGTALLSATILLSSGGVVESTSNNEVISTAKQYIGVPYEWGGMTPNGFDCSGFLSFVLGKYDIYLPRTVSEIYQLGIPVSKNELQEGDLVFYETYKAGPSHAGIYIGDGKFIQSGTSTGVTISDMKANYWSSRYIGSKRILQETPILKLISESELFYDVPVDHWAYTELSTFAQNSIIGGYSDKTFHPNKAITRAEAAKVLTYYLDLPMDAESSFSDVLSDFWAYSVISTVSDKDIFRGSENGTFRPNDVLTRAEFAVILNRIYSISNKSYPGFWDVKNDFWAANDIQALSSNQFFRGFDDGSFRPNQSTTRAEFIVVLHRLNGTPLR